MTCAVIVDYHTHVPAYEPFTRSYEDLLAQAWGSVEHLLARFPGPQQALATFAEAGVDYTVVLAEIAPITTGIASNEAVAAWCAESPRLIPFASINPHLTLNPAAELRRLVTDQGFRGLKLYPTYQYFYPNDPLVYPIYAAAQDLGIPITFHTGSSVFKGSRLKYGDPLFLDDVAVDFPDLVLVMAHGGRPCWYDHAFTMARFHANVYLELAGLPPGRLLRYFPELERIAHKTLFGSDWPSVATLKENVAAVQALPLSQAARDAILGGNAARILNVAP